MPGAQGDAPRDERDLAAKSCITFDSLKTVAAVIFLAGLALILWPDPAPPGPAALRARDIGAPDCKRPGDLKKVDLDQALQASPIDLTDANLQGADLSGKNLDRAIFFRADLSGAKLNGTKLRIANLQCADLTRVSASNANFNTANLTGAKLSDADLTGATFEFATLRAAELPRAGLDGADLRNADLVGAVLRDTRLKDARLAGADLELADYRPVGAPDGGASSNIRNLKLVQPMGPELAGLRQLSAAYANVGLDGPAREATYAAEAWHSHYLWGPADDDSVPLQSKLLVFVRWLLFDVTTVYGLQPFRALLLLVLNIFLFAGLNWLIVIALPCGDRGATGLFLVKPKERIVPKENGFALSEDAEVNKARSAGFTAVWCAFQFSIISAFRVGFREANIGEWIERLSPSDTQLRAVGALRALSGVQSLLSLYLLAIWVLTYFGRPFV